MRQLLNLLQQVVDTERDGDSTRTLRIVVVILAVGTVIALVALAVRP